MSLQTNLQKHYATDKSKVEDGVWIEFDDDVAVRIRRFNSEKVGKAREQALEGYSKSKLRRGKLTDDQNEEVAHKTLAWGVIADWRGLTQPKLDADGDQVFEQAKNEDGSLKVDDNGDPVYTDEPVMVELPYSREAALELVSDPGMAEFNAEVLAISMERDEFKAKDDEDGLGNS